MQTLQNTTETYNVPKLRRPAKLRRFMWVMLLKFKPLWIENHSAKNSNGSLGHMN